MHIAPSTPVCAKAPELLFTFDVPVPFHNHPCTADCCETPPTTISVRDAYFA